jgi:hypothetical protein
MRFTGITRRKSGIIGRKIARISRRFPEREVQISRAATLVEYREIDKVKNNCDLCFTLCKVFDYSLRVTRHQLPNQYESIRRKRRKSQN